METSLHRALKTHYAGVGQRTEVRVGAFRVDAIRDGRIIEIQHGSLAAIRDKVRQLVERRRVLVVKPIVAAKTIVKFADDGRSTRRLSPKRGRLLDLFDELVYFTRVFPHPRLALEAALVEVEEWRQPGHGRRRRWRRGDHVVEDQKLVRLIETRRITTAADLWSLLPAGLPEVFHTGDLADLLEVRRPVAQKIAYCLRECGAARQVGKRGNAWLYEAVTKRAKPRRRAA
jgi:hypothetical protein